MSNPPIWAQVNAIDFLFWCCTLMNSRVEVLLSSLQFILCTWNDNIKVFYDFFQIFVNWGLILTILTLWKQLQGALNLHFFHFIFWVHLHFNLISLFLAMVLYMFSSFWLLGVESHDFLMLKKKELLNCLQS